MDLRDEIKQLIIDTLDLEDLTIDDIDTEAPLFKEGLELDSIDALELGVVLKKKYDLVFLVDEKKNREHFYSVETLAKFIESSKK